MEFTYKGNRYEIDELKVPHSPYTTDLVAIFRLEGEIDRIFINWFAGANVFTGEELIAEAKAYIDESL